MRNIFSYKGRASRREFLIIFIVINVLWLGLGYFLSQLVDPVTNSDTYYLSKILFQVVSLMSVTPIMLQRIHDIHLPGYVLTVFYIAIPFSFSTLLYLRRTFKIESIDITWATSWPMLVLYGLNFFVLIMLFFYKSYPDPNRWGSPKNQLKDHPYGDRTSGGEPPSAP